MKEDGNILSWLKTFFVHGDFEHVSDCFNIFDEIEEEAYKDDPYGEDVYEEKEKPKNEREKFKSKSEGFREERRGDRSDKDSNRESASNSSKVHHYLNDSLLDDAYRLGKGDELLEFIDHTLKEIHDFERELDNSFEQLNEKFNTKNYQL